MPVRIIRLSMLRPNSPPLPLALLLASTCLLTACAPTLDWREMRPADTPLQAQFPCKPTTQARTLALAGEQVTLTLLACSAGNATWGLAHATLVNPAHLAAALSELRSATTTNLKVKADSGRDVPFSPPGATPNAEMRRQQVTGKLPDDSAVVADVAVFSHGLRVFQATVVGKQLHGTNTEVFFGGLRVAP